ncbi:putative quorum-sensing-regulated virulence factor [Moraxella sp. ZY210820]|uniref:putative quorum-sensing-regulated virulence factor n=1 Tax=unclassified Moraxella TaxID=2685852 RepID=UPI002730B7A4|nr:DUF3820 family protein [Moraxella sp. ZY210820]WLF84991.1 DUF3820 family protein [Moraxella sp. ZY210820]
MTSINARAIILDTETHDLNGLPIEIAYAPVDIVQGTLVLDKEQIFDQYFQVGEKISYGSMAVHHILESDLINQPDYRSFKLPIETQYIIGHNIEYDMNAIARCGIDIQPLKSICTLALARQVWKNLEAYNMSALVYYVSKGSEKARQMLKNAHRADADIILTANVLMHMLKELQVNNIEELYQISEQALIPTTIHFGKYKGTALTDLPKDYVDWLLSKDDLDSRLRQVLQNL